MIRSDSQILDFDNYPQGISMRTQLSFRMVVLAVAATLLLLVGAARAQSDFPNRPVNLIVPFPPGGAVDQAGRSIAQALSKVWKQPMVVNTRAGAGGGVGMTAAAGAPSDGYTLLATHMALLSLPEIDSMFGRKSAFDRSSFAPLALLVADPMVIVVKADAPWKTYQEFVEDARKRPDTITYSSSAPTARRICLSRCLRFRPEAVTEHSLNRTFSHPPRLLSSVTPSRKSRVR